MEVGECINKLVETSRYRNMSLNDSRTTLFGPYSFINISCGKEEIDDVQYGWKNMVEVILVTRIVQNLYKEWKCKRQELNVSIVSTYSAQIVEIKEKLGDKYSNFDGFTVKVIDIKELQGEKVDIIVLSTVRSNSDGSIGSLSNPERVNRAFTSARDCLWILGDERTLSRSTNSFWKLIILDAKARKCFFNVEQHKDLGKFVGEVKKELDQLDELLNPDSLLFMNAKWKVSFSDNFVKSFEKIKSSQKKNLVMNMLLRLANGWRPKRGVLITCDESKQSLKQYKVKDLHVICSIDIEKEQYRYVQVLKVWDVLPPVDVSKLVKLLDTVFLTYAADDLNRCKTICVEGDLEVPMSWETSHDNVYYEKHNHIEEGIRFTTEPFDYSIRSLKDFKMSENLQLMKFYPLTSDMVRHLLSDSCIGTEMILPFKLTNQEIEVVHFDRTSFILGRSGTGKTTVLIRKLFHKEQLYHLTSEGFHVLDSCTTNEKIKEDDESVKEGEETFLRQIFVTVNPILCGAVKDRVEGLKRFACGGKSAEISVSDSDVPDSFKGLHRSLFPLVISYHKFLMMLDGTLGNSFFDRFPEATRGATSLARENFIRMKEVNFDKFEQSYWPHFNRKITKILPSSIVFAEIMSCIKGGLQALNCHEGNLSREDCISLSNRRISNLDEQAREHVYDIFLHYERKKKMNSEYDLADLVTDLHRRLGEGNYESIGFDFVYIDEVQDLTMRQIALFKYICRNVNHGFVFSGDTAQTIAKGVDFRFEDIRHLFYKEFILKSRSDKNYVRGEKGLITDLFHLNKNFRTHAGILKLAQSVVNLLYYFFPDSIDVLSPETSHIMGETPSLLVQSFNDKTTFTSMLSNAGDCGKKLVGFGHDQVVLVRDDSVKEILESAGTEAIIMTISECKGLEFQDVLLYNFVSSSPLKDNWRVIDKYMKDKHFLDRGSSRSSPSFDVAAHRLLCSELKQLYVAITRTRRRLLFFENGDSDGFSNPIYDYWEKLRLVQYQTLDHSFVKKIQVHSTKEEWKSSGNEYFIKMKYKAAKECFHKAGETLLEQKAEAFLLRASAQSTYSTNFDIAEMYLNKAAKIFKSFGMFEQAVQCFYDSKNYAMAGSIYLEHYGETKLLEAGECFTRARSYDRAAFAYAKGNSFSNCLESCIQGKLFIKGLDYLSQWKEYATLNNDMERQKEEMDTTEMKILTGAAHTYKRLGNKTSMMKCVKAFHSENSKRSFLRTEGFLEELFQLEIELGHLVKAAKVAKMLGETLHAADLLEKAGHFKDASELIMSHVLANSICSPGKGWPLKQFPGKEELLDKAMSLANSDSSHFFEFVSMQRKVLVDEKVALSELLQQLSYFKRYRSISGEILCERKILDHFFGIFLNVTDLKMHAGNEFLETLVSVWNNWKENIEKITNYLSHVRSHDEYGNFCLSYLGVVVSVCYGIKEDMYLLLDPNAIWVKQIINRHLHRQGKLVFCKDKQFSRAAKSYWSEEVKSVGENVLEILKDCWEDKSLHLYGRTFALTHLNGFENSLEFLQEKNHDEVSQHLINLQTSWGLYFLWIG